MNSSSDDDEAIQDSDPHASESSVPAAGGLAKPVIDALAYVLSVPERLIKSSVAVAGGIVKELSERLLPRVLQETQLFQVFIHRGNRFFLEQIAGVEGLYAEQSAAGETYAQRKALSNVIEISSLVTLHLSPVLVLAAASDLIKGGHATLQTLVDDLRREGIIGESVRVENFNEFLQNVHGFTVKLADKADLPPLSMDELKQLGAEVQQDLKQLQAREQLSEEEVKDLAARLHQEAKAGRSVWEMGAAISYGAAQSLITGARGVVCVGQSGAKFFDEHVIQFYSEQLSLVMNEGLAHYYVRVARPYAEAMGKSWQPDTHTWTEAFIHYLAQRTH